ncbi:MAG: TonB-dependent receptor plug domain-containing protein [Methylosarcina sp.]
MLTPVILFAEEKTVYDMEIEDLMKVTVTSVSKKAQPLSDASAAIFVISNEDIKRSGATNLPDALRMAPGIDVARIDANKWAVSSRGFNGRFSNKLLVLIDGRSIYTQSFSGVYWENQDVMLEDVDRIEVIRGPGAALWGANAVNGVINIITKHSADTQGGLLTAGGGNQELGFGSFRYGAQLGADTTGRAYVKGFHRNEFNRPSGADAGDGWDKVQGGFRIDSLWTDRDDVTLQGDLYQGNINQDLRLASLQGPAFVELIDDTGQTHGGNVLGRIHHAFANGSDATAQLYYDVYHRAEGFDEETRYTIDFDFLHHFYLNDWNEISWGLGYRYTRSQNNLVLPNIFYVDPVNRGDPLYSAFLQDEIPLFKDTVRLNLGSKFEHNNYTGFEIQPTARLLWMPHRQHRLWAAVSRAVRTPSAIDSDLQLLAEVQPSGSANNPSPFPMAMILQGNKEGKAEVLLAYEMGYRFTFSNFFSMDMALFYNDYERLRSFELGSPGMNGSILQQPVLSNNNSKGQTYGFETAASWTMLDWWRWDLSYSFIKTHLESNELFKEAVSPQQKISLRSSITPWKTINLDLWLRYSGSSSTFNIQQPVNIDDYVTLDLRLGWNPVKDIELSVTGQNLLDGSHLESVSETFVGPTEIQRGVYGKIEWKF